MSKTRYITTSFWSDPWIVDHLNPLDRYLFFYFLTNEHTTIAGIYEMSLRTIANETGLDKEEVLRMLKRLEPKIIYLDGWVIIPNAIRHQNYNSPKIKTGIESVLQNVPAELIDYVKFPADFDAQKYKTNKQTRLITDDFTSESPTNINARKSKSLGVRYGIDTLSHSNTNSKPNTNSNVVTNVTTITQPDKPAAKVSSHDIDTVMAAWDAEVGLDIGHDRKQRDAVSKLLKQRGLKVTLQLVTGVASALDDRYAPRIADFPSLCRKQNDLILWGRKRGNGNNVEVIS